MEILFAPVTLHLKGNMFHYRIRVLEHVLIRCHIGEFRQFAFAHVLLNDNRCPAVLVLNLTVLNTTEGVEEFL